MISIPNEMLEKYGILPYEECAQQWAEIEDEVEKEKLFCRLFLSETDFITSKILEGVATSADYADELYYRKIDGNVYSPKEYPAGWEVTS